MTILKTEEVAQIFKVHPATIANWALRGLIVGSRIGKNWFFTEEAVQDAMETNRG